MNWPKTMDRKYILTTLMLLLAAYSAVYAQEQVLYKQVDTTKLFMEVYRPAEFDTAQKYPAIIFFFGGGWNVGTTNQFKPQAEYFSQRGMICFLADYRVRKRHHTTPFESVKDAKSAIRFLREHAEELCIDTSRIVASGGSAGGQLAAATALISEYNENTDDVSVSCVPNALVLFNPVFDNGPGGYGYGRIGDAYKNFSPLHNIRKGAPPTIIFFGTKDKHVPPETAEYYKTVMERVGSRCELNLYKGQEHGFFNEKNSKYFKKTVAATDEFLQSLGILTKNPEVKFK